MALLNDAKDRSRRYTSKSIGSVMFFGIRDLIRKNGFPSPSRLRGTLSFDFLKTMAYFHIVLRAEQDHLLTQSRL
jgi:hypothetical protein